MNPRAWIISALLAIPLTPIVCIVTVLLVVHAAFHRELITIIVACALMFPFGFLGATFPPGSLAGGALQILNGYLWSFVICATVTAIYRSMYLWSQRDERFNRSPLNYIRFRLRTLLILLVVVPPVLAGLSWRWVSRVTGIPPHSVTVAHREYLEAKKSWENEDAKALQIRGEIQRVDDEIKALSARYESATTEQDKAAADAAFIQTLPHLNQEREDYYSQLGQLRLLQARMEERWSKFEEAQRLAK